MPHDVEKKQTVRAYLDGMLDEAPALGVAPAVDATALRAGPDLGSDLTEVRQQVRAAEAVYAANPDFFVEYLSALSGQIVPPDVPRRSLQLMKLAVDDPVAFHDHFLVGDPSGAPGMVESSRLLSIPGKLYRAYPQLAEDDKDYGRITLNAWKMKFQSTDPRWVLYAPHELAGRLGAWPNEQPFIVHQDPHGFVYDANPIPDAVALFSDFGTGYYHSLHIARQIRDARVPYAFHLGDVYYSGSEREFARYFTTPLAPVMRTTKLFALPENHELYSGGEPYQTFLRQHDVLQEGSYFCLRTPAHQIIGVDVNWQKRQTFLDPSGAATSPINRQRAWLASLLEDRDRTTILLTGSAPYVLGDREPTKLWDAFKAFAAEGQVHLWFWGDNHYGALFDYEDDTPFFGSCIGHGGYPFFRVSEGQEAPATPLWTETTTRFPAWTGTRPDLGNNGWCLMQLVPDGGVRLLYRDWLGNDRARATFRRQPGSAGRFRLALTAPVEKVPIPDEPPD